MDLLVKVFFALPVYQSLVLAIVLFVLGWNKPGISRIIMGFFQVVLAAYFSFNFMYVAKAYYLIEIGYPLIIPIILLFAPLFHLFVLSVSTPDFAFKPKHALHFLPALVILVLQIPYLFFDHATRIEYLSNGVRLSDSNSELLYLYVLYTIGVYVIFNIQILYYAYQAIKRYKQHKRYIGNHFSYTENISLHWILALIISVILLFAINEVLYLIGFKQHYVSQIFYNVSMLVITLFAAYRGMLQKELILRTAYPLLQIEHDGQANALLGQPEQVDDELSNDEADEVALLDVATSIETQKYAGSGLSAEQKQVLINKLEHLISTEKLFANCNLTVEDVASRLEARPKHVSQVINEHYQRNFYNFINYYRIVEAQKLLLSDEFEKYSIQGIAQMVGFVSKSTFNTAFKKQTGQTPSEFKKKHGTDEQ